MDDTLRIMSGCSGSLKQVSDPCRLSRSTGSKAATGRENVLSNCGPASAANAHSSVPGPCCCPSSDLIEQRADSPPAGKVMDPCSGRDPVTQKLRSDADTGCDSARILPRRNGSPGPTADRSAQLHVQERQIRQLCEAQTSRLLDCQLPEPQA